MTVFNEDLKHILEGVLRDLRHVRYRKELDHKAGVALSLAYWAVEYASAPEMQTAPGEPYRCRADALVALRRQIDSFFKESTDS